MCKVLLNKSVKFQIKIPNGCWENSKKNLGAHFFVAPCTCTFGHKAYGFGREGSNGSVMWTKIWAIRRFFACQWFKAVGWMTALSTFCCDSCTKLTAALVFAGDWKHERLTIHWICRQAWLTSQKTRHREVVAAAAEYIQHAHVHLCN